MIQDAIQKILTDQGITAFGSIAKSLPPRPFAVHKVQQDSVVRTKGEIMGYTWAVSVILVHHSLAALNTLRASMVANFEAILDTEIEGTTIEVVTELGNDGAEFDDENQTFYDNINFEIETLNK
jgi:hypothetical protein